MAFTLHTLKRSAGRSKPAKRVGRGWGSGKGKTGGKGTKGQKARSGGGSGLKLKGLRKQLMSMPKISTFKSIYSKYVVVNLDQLEKNFENGARINASTLFDKGLLKTKANGVKILGNGKLTKKLNVIVDDASASAAKAITEAGGTLKTLAKKIKKEKPVK